MFGEERLDWLRLYGDVEHGIPGHDTIARVISRINPKQLQSSFVEWMQDCQQLSEGSVIAPREELMYFRTSRDRLSAVIMNRSDLKHTNIMSHR